MLLDARRWSARVQRRPWFRDDAQLSSQRYPQSSRCSALKPRRYLVGSRVRYADPAEREGRILTTDMTLQCRDCGRDFVFTVGEQEFYASRGLTHNPSRCPECRAARKNGAGGYGGERAPRQMFVATCSACGGEARVPFQPRGDKPVYCSSCFQQMGGGARGASSTSYSRDNNW